MIEQTVVALLLLINNEIKEARIQDSLSICLKRKRYAQRLDRADSRIQHKCIKTLAEIETNIDGSKTIKKLILN